MGTFTCANVGSNTTTLTVTDVNGNTATCAATVTVIDTIDPTIVCPANINLPADSSICGAIATWTAPTPTDNCTIQSTSSTQPSGATFPSGQTTVTYTVDDVNGNSSTCSFTVTVTPRPLVVDASSLLQGCGYHLACAGDSNATVSSYVSGGCMPYQYAWSTGSTSDNITGLPVGMYYVTVTDLQSNVSIDSVLITAPAPLTLSITGDTVACQNSSTASLAATGSGGQDCAAYSYLWNTGDTTNSISGIPAGIYTVTLTDNLGCTITGADTVELGIIPTLDLGPDTTKCPGTSLLFEAPPIYSAYLWNNGTQNSTILLTTPGDYILTVWTAEGCTDTDTVRLTDNIVDYNIINPSGSLNICDGDTLTLAGDAGLTGYSWSTGDTTQSIVVAGAGGSFILNATDPNGCATMDTVIVNYTPFTDPFPVVTPGPNAILCDGGTLQLDVQTGYFAYSWSNGATTQSITISTPGIYQATVSNGFGCTRASLPVTVTVGALPTPVIAVGGGILTTGSYNSYQWLLGGSPIIGAITQSYVPVQAGFYSVTVTDSNGCAGTSPSVYYNPVGVADEVANLNGLTLYPNPTNGMLNLRTLDPIDWPIEVEIWDMFGQKVKVYDMAHLMDVIAFDVSDLSSAPYLMKITTFRQNKSHQAVIRFVKE